MQELDEYNKTLRTIEEIKIIQANINELFAEIREILLQPWKQKTVDNIAVNLKSEMK